jgi:multiple antibiotic resistance protein
MVDLAALFSFDPALFAEAFLLLFAILDPVGTVPIFMALTEDKADKRRQICRQSVTLATAILFIFAYLGWFIFQILGITLNDFRIAGGIVLFIVAYDHLSGKEARTRKLEAAEVAAFPIATPLLAGPGAISTVVILANPPFGPLVTFVVITLNAILTFFILNRSELVQRLLGVNGTRALTRITALLIAAVGVAFVRQGIVDIIKSISG